MIAHMVGTEKFRELLSEKTVQVLAGINHLVGAAHEKRVINDVDDSLHLRHGFGIQVLPDLLADKQQFGLAVVHDVVNLIGLEFMQNRHRYGTISQCSQKGGSPMGRILVAKSNFISRAHTAIFKDDM